jgi:DNA modification methylase
MGKDCIDVAASGLHIGDCRDLVSRLPEGSVQTCVTSPPYWGLRDYGTARWDGGDSLCDHRESKPSRVEASIASSTLGGGKATIHASHVFRGDCGRCGAKRIDVQIGLEPTPAEYVASLVEVFRGVRRALRDDGTLWLNLGDTYAGSRAGEQGQGGAMADRSVAKQRCRVRNADKIVDGLKPKDLVGIPWRVAFALQDDGWYLRMDVIWSKPNPMPESVTDRPTKAHEYVFLLSKSERYFYDKREASERSTWAGQGRSSRDPARSMMPGAPPHRGLRKDEPTGTRNIRSVWTIAPRPYKGRTSR